MTLRRSFLPSSGLGFILIALPVTAVLAAAIWLAASAAYENVRFAQTAEQLLSLVALARDSASKDPNFGRQPGENLIASLIRRGQLAAPGDGAQQTLTNDWQGEVRAETSQPFLMRLETELPARDCRRLALFLSNDLKALALQKMEAREGNGFWRLFYDVDGGQGFSQPAAAVACGQGEQVTLALTLRLH